MSILFKVFIMIFLISFISIPLWNDEKEKVKNKIKIMFYLLFPWSVSVFYAIDEIIKGRKEKMRSVLIIMIWIISMLAIAFEWEDPLAVFFIELFVTFVWAFIAMAMIIFYKEHPNFFKENG